MNKKDNINNKDYEEKLPTAISLLI